MILTNLPDTASAQALSERLVADRLVACANILPGCRSVYRWQGQVDHAEEVPVLLKTVASRYTEVEAAIRAHHPYELPEIVALPVRAGLPGYLAWVAAETAADA